VKATENFSGENFSESSKWYWESVQCDEKLKKVFTPPPFLEMGDGQ
jgi:hypothetical protein